MAHEPIHEMFLRTANRLGGIPAIAWGGHAVTYRQLAERSAGLANALLGAGALPGEPVAILASHSADVIAAMLGVLRAGGAFVPLDPRFPVATLPAVIGEVRPRWWLVDAEHSGLVERLRSDHGLDASVVALTDGLPAAGAAPTTDPPPVPLDADAFCYIYFTSGSTARPKGIAGRLKAIDHFVRWEAETFGVGEGTRASQLTSPAFDAFLRDVFLPLAVGGTVCVPESREVVMDGARLADWIDDERLELVHCTPSLFRTILGQPLEPDRFGSLRHVLLAGEPLLPSDVRKWHGCFGDRIQLVNLYGPSETTMVKLFYRVRQEDGEARSIPIGQPMPGARVIVVDERSQPCPPGKLGEIYIRTPYRALGYYNRPELTAEAFIRNPFSDRPEDIVYKTGDLGRLREDGNLEYVGRRDLQVKVRGVRVELAPIEDVLRSHEDVAEAVVVDRTDTQGNKFLCAYMVPKPGRELATAPLADQLRTHLPESAVPSAFLILESLPRTLSGKIDRRALPDPGQMGARLGREYVAPQTPVEERLCGLFAELLGLPRVGIQDNFFELGGHSLLATLLMSRIRSEFSIEVPLRHIFRTPTAEGLALAVTQLQLAQESDEEVAALLREVQSLEDIAPGLLEGQR